MSDVNHQSDVNHLMEIILKLVEHRNDSGRTKWSFWYDMESILSTLEVACYFKQEHKEKLDLLLTEIRKEIK